jgi:YjbE family integral membrane protein
MDLSTHLIPLFQIIMIDLVLAGDNAIIVGLAASRVAPHLRAKVIFWGIAGAVVLRILFAAVTAQLLQVVGLMLAGGLLLLWVCWKMYRDLRTHAAVPHSLGSAAVMDTHSAAPSQATQLGFWAALWQIIVADVSMSLDNVLAVAGVAKGNTMILVIGLAVAVVLMAVAATWIAGLLARHAWIGWIGLAIITYVAFDMMWDGAQEIGCYTLRGSMKCPDGLVSLVQEWMTKRM